MYYIILLLIIIIIIFIIFIIKYKKEYFKNKKNYLCIQTVFILNENIKWLDEYIKYHKNLGVEHFYLYDNEGTTGGDGSTNENKYGMKIKNFNTNEDKKKLKKILKKYSDIITIIKWQPKDKNGNIIYGQNEAISHFKKKFGKYNKWVCLIDLDEYLFSPKNINLIKFLKSLEKKNISGIKINQKKFKDRFLTNEKYIINEYNCIDKKIGKEWGAKNIILCNELLNKQTNIHYIKTKKKIIDIKNEILRFNHYNVNEKQLNWMTNFYKLNKKFKLNSIDNSMKRYKYITENL